MVNYYQKMRERNNEASKRCRLKRRIKQDSLDKTKILLESHREALSHRVAKLHKIKNILNDVCRSVYIPGLPMLCLYNLCEYIYVLFFVFIRCDMRFCSTPLFN